ncbi:MAG TPA: hypothetical protein VGS58_10520 [Candidatus Sulfopaludibacter sp.]|nr:hypothetical protein [Candidatus Sulfopaludibacter sp.]
MLKLLKQARTALRHLNPDEVRKMALRPVHIGLVAADGAAYGEMEDYLIPAGVGPERRLELLEFVHRAGDPGVPDQVDVVLYYEGISGPKGTYTFHPADPGASVRGMLHGNDDIALPLARQFSPFRRPVVEQTIHAVSQENAIFAVATALPDVVPNLMEVPWALGEWASDTAFLTANQVRMAFLIAAACDREVGFAHQKLEILSIGGGAFGWRALARELAGKIPLGGGLIPKGAIAYAGTFAVGKGLEHLYGANARMSGEARKSIYRQGLERGREIVQSLTR